ncbi:putative multi antimicrobial extrusion protein [Actinacidiphila reveromycinica]|uniref:Putative multi antimicrobial extrusion protein n=1 Tax=Actinacidiphila reveromycinica TaxID=659352 RepID=A0A7U3VML0_9ACTN|nr:MATE family efflux transporter [Streptomyces sp. SN-593]BBA96687.1 putative multi antimicrobial extrusion protein [Streptomyces sp. SN-593]
MSAVRDDRPGAPPAGDRPGPAPSAAAEAVSYRRILRIALPMVLSTATGIGSQLVVTGLIGRIGSDALYVRSVYTPIAYLFLAVTTGLGVTVQVCTAQAVGRGTPALVRRHLGSIARVGTAVLVALGGLLVLLAGPLGEAVEIEPGRSGTFHVFLAAMAGAAVLGMLGELTSSVLRGMGRTGTAAAVTALYVALNLGSIVVAGPVLGGGLMVVPCAAGAAGLVELLLGLAVLARAGIVGRAAGRAGWMPGTPGILLRVGLPVGASSIVLAVVNLLLLRIVAPFGPDVVAGFTVGSTVQTAVIVPAVGFGSAVSVLMNHQLSGGRPAAARTVFRRGLLLAAAGYALVTVVMLAAGGPLAGLLSGDPAVAHQARHFLAVVGPVFGCTGVMLCVLTVMEQVGRGLLAVLLNAGYFAAVLVIGWSVVHARHDVTALYWTMAVAAAASLVTGLPAASRAALRPRLVAHGPETTEEPT